MAFAVVVAAAKAVVGKEEAVKAGETVVERTVALVERVGDSEVGQGCLATKEDSAETAEADVHSC